MNRLTALILALSFWIGPASVPMHALASESNGTISATEKYAWGENIGWVNFNPTSGGLNITDTDVTGYVWSNGSGWINFNPSGNSNPGVGVRNTCGGNLSGAAWSSRLGWIDMTGVTIDAAGLFTGIAGAAGSTTGRIAFDCATCAVRTDWRPCASRSTTTPGTGGGGGTLTGGGGGSSATIPAQSSGVSQSQSALTGAVQGIGPSCVDIIKDGVVDILDFNMLIVNWGAVGSNNIADTNGDGTVDILDFNSVMVCWSAALGF